MLSTKQKIKMSQATLIDKDLAHIWHPCSQMKDYENFKPIIISKACGSYFELDDGRKIIDAISSWWCKLLGHNHPRLKNALIRQMDQFEHVIFTNTTNETITLLSEKLAHLTHTLNKIFYASDGSSAIDIALKMSLQVRQIRGEFKKNKFIALSNGYHGESIAALSVSDVDLYKKHYKSLLFDVLFLTKIPYVTNISDPLWFDCSSYWHETELVLEKYRSTTTAIILEPIVQAASGMKIYSQDFLKRLSNYCSHNNIHLICDEIMTGIGRTGKMLACQHANIEPDFLCLAKGLTAGWLPMSAVLTSHEIYQHFYADYQKGTSFLHSNTFSGNALAASVAVEVLAIVNELNICDMANQLGEMMASAMVELAEETGKITNIRHIGAIVAADLVTQDVHRRLGFEIYQKAVEYGAFLRPLGNTIYWCPPINTSRETISELKYITKKSLLAVNF